MKTKKTGNLIIVIRKNYWSFGQSAFLRKIYSNNDGPPPEINLTNEKNNGLAVLKLIKDNLVLSVMMFLLVVCLVALAEMSIASMLGLKIYKPKKFSDFNEYFFGEDQGRYLLKLTKIILKKLKKSLKKNNISTK